jgi:hypothetical protein
MTLSTIRKTPDQENQTPHLLTFLLRCRDHDIIPRFLQFHHHIHSQAANRIYQRPSFALLRERIQHNNTSYLPGYEVGTDSVPKRWHLTFTR